MDLSVARAVFTSALLRSDPPAPDIKRDDATIFTKTLLKTLNCCTRSDVQICKSFIVHNVLPSTSRTAALAKYTTIIAKACSPRPSGEKVDTMKPSDENEGLGKIVNGKVTQAPDPAWKRLHLLYVLHDVLAHVYGRLKDAAHAKSSPKVAEPSDMAIDEHLKPAVLLLAELAACGSSSSMGLPQTLPLVNDLVDMWSGLAIFDPRSLPKFRTGLAAAAETSWPDFMDKLDAQDREKAAEVRRRKENESKWILPTHHGVPNDPAAPWYDLPATNGLYQKRTSGYPLRSRRLPQGGYPLTNGGREADMDLRREINWLHKECLRHFDKYTDPEEVADVDALGSIIWKDPERPTRNYWGWSYDGIEKKKQVARMMAEKGFSSQDIIDDDPIERARALAASGGGGGVGLDAMGPGMGYQPMGFDQGYGYQNDTSGAMMGGRGGRGGFRGDFRGGVGRGRGFRGGRW